MAPRGKMAPVNRWWLRLARTAVQNEPGPLGELGARLAKHVGRERPWAHTVLSRFKDGKEPVTVELADALCTEYRLPPPVFFPRSYNEAVEMMRVTEKYDGLTAEEGEEEAPVVPMRKPRRTRPATAEAPSPPRSHAADGGKRR